MIDCNAELTDKNIKTDNSSPIVTHRKRRSVLSKQQHQNHLIR